MQHREAHPAGLEPTLEYVQSELAQQTFNAAAESVQEKIRNSLDTVANRSGAGEMESLISAEVTAEVASEISAEASAEAAAATVAEVAAAATIRGSMK